MTGNAVCWTSEAIEYATQVDAGGFEVGDTYADAVFSAIHQPLPLRRVRDVARGAISEAQEIQVLEAFTKPINSNEPLLLFVTGGKGTGKSHLVRWLKTQVGPRQDWHIVYVEKRNTDLRKVIERILAGIETPNATQLRSALAQASSGIQTDQEAMDALLMRLDHLVKWDPAIAIAELPGTTPAELLDLRMKANRLLGDFSFRRLLCAPGGPIERIVRLARGDDADKNIDEQDLHLRETDFKVDLSLLDQAGAELQRLAAAVLANRNLRTDIAALCTAYLPRAKAEVFTGQTTNLLDVFQDVRREIASRGQELCIYIEDLVLLHGIDKQLAQALTVPASAELCKLRAAIAVTSGYLKSVDTFTDRGIHFTMDVPSSSIDRASLRDFVGRYLNAGRLGREELVAANTDATPNACAMCPRMDSCHEVFGASQDGHGYYPFNATAIDRLVTLASPDEFRPREVLREVVRAPLDVAQAELPFGGVFPSEAFAQVLDKRRENVPSTLRDRIRRENPSSAEAELSLRAYYAESPTSIDSSVAAIAQYFGVRLTESLGDNDDSDLPAEETQAQRKSGKTNDDAERWANGEQLASVPALKVRKWICELVLAQIRNGPYGLPIQRISAKEWHIGSHTLRVADIKIERSMGGGGTYAREIVFELPATDASAQIVRGILASDEGKPLDHAGDGYWYFALQAKLDNFIDEVVTSGSMPAELDVLSALRVLAVLRHVSPEPGSTVAEALGPMLLPAMPADPNPKVRELWNAVRPVREQALATLRSACVAAKGSGSPSIIDVSEHFAALRACLKQPMLPDEVIAKADQTSKLWVLHSKQARAAEDVRAQLEKQMKSLNRVFDGEDLDNLAKKMDQLVAAAHEKGRLPRHDSKSDYEEARRLLDLSENEVYREVEQLLSSDPSAADIWAVLADPVPVLTRLEKYAGTCHDLLQKMESAADVSEADATGGDAAVVVAAIRSLADELDVFVSKAVEN